MGQTYVNSTLRNSSLLTGCIRVCEALLTSFRLLRSVSLYVSASYFKNTAQGIPTVRDVYGIYIRPRTCARGWNLACGGGQSEVLGRPARSDLQHPEDASWWTRIRIFFRRPSSLRYVSTPVLYAETDLCSSSRDPPGILAAAYVNGLQENGVAATIKHYVGNDQEHERTAADSVISDRALREIYLYPCATLVQMLHARF